MVINLAMTAVLIFSSVALYEFKSAMARIDKLEETIHTTCMDVREIQTIDKITRYNINRRINKLEGTIQ